MRRVLAAAALAAYLAPPVRAAAPVKTAPAPAAAAARAFDRGEYANALAEHRSQVEGDMLGFFKQWLPEEAEESGKKIGVQHAEAFRVLQFE